MRLLRWAHWVIQLLRLNLQRQEVMQRKKMVWKKPVARRGSWLFRSTQKGKHQDNKEQGPRRHGGPYPSFACQTSLSLSTKKSCSHAWCGCAIVWTLLEEQGRFEEEDRRPDGTGERVRELRPQLQRKNRKLECELQRLKAMDKQFEEWMWLVGVCEFSVKVVLLLIYYLWKLWILYVINWMSYLKIFVIISY